VGEGRSCSSYTPRPSTGAGRESHKCAAYNGGENLEGISTWTISNAIEPHPPKPGTICATPPYAGTVYRTPRAPTGGAKTVARENASGSPEAPTRRDEMFPQAKLFWLSYADSARSPCKITKQAGLRGFRRPEKRVWHHPIFVVRARLEALLPVLSPRGLPAKGIDKGPKRVSTRRRRGSRHASDRTGEFSYTVGAPAHHTADDPIAESFFVGASLVVDLTPEHAQAIVKVPGLIRFRGSGRRLGP